MKERIHIGSQQNVASNSAVLADLPEGVRLISQDTLTRHSNAAMMRDGRALLTGEVRLAFFRPGRQRVPPLRVILKGVASDRGLPLESEASYVEVVPTLPAGNPSLKDIRDQRPETSVDPMLVAAVAVLVLGLGWLGGAVVAPPSGCRSGDHGRARAGDRRRVGAAGTRAHRAGGLGRAWGDGTVLRGDCRRDAAVPGDGRAISACGPDIDGVAARAGCATDQWRLAWGRACVR